VAALFIGGAGMWLRRRIEEDSRREQERRRALELKAAHALDTPRAESAGVLGVAIAPSSNGVEPARAPREATFE
jgi:hypothetical protein